MQFANATVFRGPPDGSALSGVDTTISLNYENPLPTCFGTIELGYAGDYSLPTPGSIMWLPGEGTASFVLPPDANPPTALREGVVVKVP